MKDAIEAIGVPHVEVGAILINDVPSTFSAQVKANDRISVYPIDELPDLQDGSLLRPPVSDPPRFILDVHLGSLARLLRMLGFDVYYDNHYSDQRIAELASIEDRIVLTRDVGLLKHKIITWGRWLRSQHTEEQFNEVKNLYNLSQHFKPFSRCISCNGFIHSVSKQNVQSLVPIMTYEVYSSFYQCSNCKKVFWKGTHFDKMVNKIRSLT